MTIKATIIADSIANGIRLTTLELEYPRFIHSQMMTHRMFSRNASSSRAIPVEKIISQVEKNPAIPISWGKNKPGMQAGEELSNVEQQYARLDWISALEEAAYRAESLAETGVHKQIVNRLLEPFSHIKVIVTATEWDNFFKLRLHEDSQPEIQELARVMLSALKASKPQELNLGEWHLPYVSWEEIETWWFSGENPTNLGLFEVAVKCSVARCARVSYNNHDNSTPDIEKDIKLADKLLAAGHMSCFEHQATPLKKTIGEGWWLETGVTHLDIYGGYWSNNFRGWKQYRALL